MIPQIAITLIKVALAAGVFAAVTPQDTVVHNLAEDTAHAAAAGAAGAAVFGVVGPALGAPATVTVAGEVVATENIAAAGAALVTGTAKVLVDDADAAVHTTH